ncbi:MAG: GTP cyclohydrolase II [Myxococcales bacterium]|nr:GTP cyclohydrolase II [Myxococcales bacterium]MBL0196147.1 GTP cyclohydrolase II [Myxococcales bacterium]
MFHPAGSDATRTPRVRVEAMSALPTRFGDFRIYVFSAEGEHREHVAMVRGDVWGATEVLTRLHSECLTGDIMSSLRCDCREQLERGLELVGAANQGIVLYLRQEGRGIGLANKIRAYKLQQEQGLDTVDANLALGFQDDLRDYGVAAALLRTLGVRSVDLLTNNPAKVLGLQRHGMAVTSRVPHAIAPGQHNEAYLATKAMRSGHLLPLPSPRSTRTP